MSDNRDKLASDPTAPIGSYGNPVRYKHIKKDDPEKKAKQAAQREQFSKDAGDGKVLCLSDLMISHEL